MGKVNLNFLNNQYIIDTLMEKSSYRVQTKNKTQHKFYALVLKIHQLEVGSLTSKMYD